MPPARRAPGSAFRRHLPAVALLAIYAGLALGAVRGKCVTFDETAHLTAGYSYWLADDYRLQPENGNLPQRWAALPLLIPKPRFPDLDGPAWWLSNVWQLGWQFFYRVGNDADQMLFAGRAMIAVLGVALGGLVYAWSLSLFGIAGARLSLLLYAFCPTMLANGALVTSDMAAALFFTATVWTLWRACHRLTWGGATAFAACTAGLFLSKMSALLVAPMILAVAGISLASGRPMVVRLRRERVIDRLVGRAALLAALGALTALAVWAAIWCGAGFRYDAFRGSETGRDRLYPAGWEAVLEGGGWETRAVEFLRSRRLLPESYLYGLAMTLHYAQERRAFWNGAYGVRGWPGFFPYCFAVKTPLPLFAILALSAAALAARRRRGQAPPWSELLPLAVLLGVYWAAAVLSHLNIGHRHLLPVYPATLILGGGAAWWLRRDSDARAEDRRWAQPAAALAVTLAAALFAGESVYRWPNYISYFNQLVGGPWNGYRHLVDSSLDWGQDLPGLRRWLESHGSDRNPVYLSYFGTGSPSYYDVHAALLPSFGTLEPMTRPTAWRGGTYCISATMLQGLYLAAPGRWTQEREADYRELVGFLDHYERTRDDPVARQALLKQAGNPDVAHIRDLAEQFRFARLCAYLRLREPDDEVGYSILIYRLSDANLDAALLGPPPLAAQ